MDLEQAANAVVETPATEAVAEPQSTETQPTEQTTAQTEQHPTETQAFARRLKERIDKRDAEWQARLAEEQRKADEFAAWAYKEHGVTSLQEAMALRQNWEFREQYGVDRTAVEPIVQEAVAQHPDVLAAREYKYALMLDKEALAMAEKLPEAGVKNGDELRALIEADAGMTNLVYDRGLSPMQAYRALYGDEIAAKRAEKAAQETIAKISANAVATPGPVGNAADAPITFTASQLANPDQKRLVTDDAYYKAYMTAYRQHRKG